jgi:hypothetical protein
MKTKNLEINFRYLWGNIACLSVDSMDGKSVHNDINDEEAIIIFNSLVGEKENCQTVKTLLKENQELKKQLEDSNEKIILLQASEPMLNYKKALEETQQKEFINYLEDEINKLKEQIKNYDIWHEVGTDINFLILKKQFYLEILQKYKEIIGDDK